MRSRFRGGFGVSWLPVFGRAAGARGNSLGGLLHRVSEDTVRRNCWPAPFLYPTRQAAREPFATMVANGWERQNMLTDGHFDSRTGSSLRPERRRCSGSSTNIPSITATSSFTAPRTTRQETAARIARRRAVYRAGRSRPASIRRCWSPAVGGGYSAEGNDAVGRNSKSPARSQAGCSPSPAAHPADPPLAR